MRMVIDIRDCEAQEEGLVEREAKIAITLPQVRNARSHQMEEARKDPPPEPLEGEWLCHILISDF